MYLELAMKDIAIVIVLKTRHFRNYVFVDAHQRHFGGEVWHTGISHILYDYSKFSAADFCNVS